MAMMVGIRGAKGERPAVAKAMVDKQRTRLRPWGYGVASGGLKGRMRERVRHIDQHKRGKDVKAATT